MTGTPELANGFVPAGTAVTGVLALERVLAHWAAASDKPTVGDIGAYGGSPVIIIQMTADEFALNRDTTRAAVREFLAAAARAGCPDNLGWHVTANAKGRCNRVTYRPGNQPTPGWYAYLRSPADRPRELR